MQRLKSMKETLVGCVQSQLADISHADTHELGEAIDMIKDLEEAMYYCSIVKAMEEKEEDHCHLIPYPVYERDMDRDMGRMYFDEPRRSHEPFSSIDRGRVGNDSRYRDGRWEMGGEKYREREVPVELRDSREGRSPMSRRNYMESKELHHGKEKKLKELEKYMQELSEDIVEMIQDASPEEKQILEKKMTHLASKIAQLNVNA